MKRGAELLLIALLLTSCASRPAALSFDPPPPFDNALWGVLVEDDDGRVLFSRNAHTLFMPASNRKLFAASTIASCLGTGAQLSTEILRDGDDLLVRGGADPTLGSSRYERDGDFDRVAETLRARGVTRVRDVVADVSLFSDRVLIPGSWKVGNLNDSYSAPVDALAWKENALPNGDAIHDPGMATAAALRDALLLHGIEVTGAPRVETAPRPAAELLLSLPSPFVAQLLTTVLKNSQNLYTEMLLKRAGGGTYEEAFAHERQFIAAEAGVDPHEARFADGSGLSTDDLVTPAAIVKILRWMNAPVRRGFWWSVLAQPANEGTLRRRLVTLESRLRGKTGTINGVNALSGIIAMPDGSYRYFSIIVNHHIDDGDEAVKVMDAFVERAASTTFR